MPSVRTHKERPPFGYPVHMYKETPRFYPIPAPQPRNSTLPLGAVLGDTRIEQIKNAKQIVFHAVGDTGGIHGTEVQEALANAMEAQFTANNPHPAKNNPAFFYHLGDVIYFNGQSRLYPTEFYEPYQYYPGVIFAIPGNHDGDIHVRANDLPDTEPSLYGLMHNFCAPQRTPISAYRDAMTQPYPFWTLTAPFVTIIGLYGNVDGTLDGPGTRIQQQWLAEQLQQADKSTCIIVAVHQPPYSLDTTHCGYPHIRDAINQVAEETGVWPHAVFSGHVHNYQRFTRRVKLDNRSQREIPFLVAGAGGFANKAQRLHKIQRDDNGNLPPRPFPTQEEDVELSTYNEEEPGFLRVTVTERQLTTEYFTVPFDGGPARLFDKMVLDHRKGSLISNSGA